MEGWADVDAGFVGCVLLDDQGWVVVQDVGDEGAVGAGRWVEVKVVEDASGVGRVWAVGGGGAEESGV